MALNHFMLMVVVAFSQLMAKDDGPAVDPRILTVPSRALFPPTAMTSDPDKLAV